MEAVKRIADRGWGDQALRREFLRKTGRSWIVLVASLVGIVITGVLMGDDEESDWGYLLLVIFPAFLFGIAFVLNDVITALRLRSPLYEFEGRFEELPFERTAAFKVLTFFQPMANNSATFALVLLDPESSQVNLLSVVSCKWNARRLEGSPRLLFCGKPGRGGVVSRTDRARPVNAYKPMFREEQLKVRALEAEKLDPASWS